MPGMDTVNGQWTEQLRLELGYTYFSILSKLLSFLLSSPYNILQNPYVNFYFRKILMSKWQLVYDKLLNAFYIHF